ncbi:MAG TPA: FliG C-terminal domain-containing protein [Bacteroidales bacterium]|nr:FliG C-terminal domain-containing protein [Bacteroidales bacterium]
MSSKSTLKDVLKINKTGLNQLVKDIDIKTLYFALADADNKVKKTMITHLGKTQLKEYNKLFTENIPVTEADIEKARKVILASIRKLI